MTKEEMMDAYYINANDERNYEEAQKRIREAMQNGEKYVYLPGKNGSSGEFSWSATYDTIARLREDGFDIDKVWDPWEYWSVEWGYNDLQDEMVFDNQSLAEKFVKEFLID